MKIAKEYFETTWKGEEKVIEQTNGVTVRVLKKPSPEYLKMKADAAAARKPQEDARKAAQERERLIQERMRKIAEDQLTAEGKI
jgi:hypothetical protein